MNDVARKPVFGVSNQVQQRQACSAVETSWMLEISYIATRGNMLSMK